MQIPTGERGVVRLFALDLPPDAVAKAAAEEDAATVRGALGAETLDPAYVEVFDARDVAEIGLAAYLVQGAGIPEAALAEDRGRLDALTGPLVVVTSGAFGGHAQTIAPRAPLRWIGTWAEDLPPVHFEALPDASAHGAVHGAAPGAVQPVQLTDAAPPEEEGAAGPATTPAQRRLAFAIVAAIAVVGIALALLVMSLHG